MNEPPKTESSNPVFARTTPKANGPQRWQDYLAYPRILFMVILAILIVALFIAFGVYVLFFEGSAA